MDSVRMQTVTYEINVKNLTQQIQIIILFTVRTPYYYILYYCYVNKLSIIV